MIVENLQKQLLNGISQQINTHASFTTINATATSINIQRSTVTTHIQVLRKPSSRC